MTEQPGRRSAPSKKSGFRRRVPIRTLHAFDAEPKPVPPTSTGGRAPTTRGGVTRKGRSTMQSNPRGGAARPPASRTPRRQTGSYPQRRREVTAPFRHLKRTEDENGPVLPSLSPNSVRVVPLGGVEEVGKNMLVVETPEDLIVVDAGFQFISDEESPGIDYVLPNTKYIEDRLEKVRAVVITHGHLDHIGGLPYVLERIGNPPVYATEVTALLIKKRQEEFPHLPKPDVRVVERESRITVGSTPVRFFPVTHSISDSCGVSIETPHGNIVISGDLKLEHDDGTPSAREKKTWGEIGKAHNILLIADSTNAEKSGFSIPEKVVHQTIGDIMKEAKGRIIIGTFASQFERMIHIIGVAEQLNKKVVTEGRSIRTNIEIAKLSGRLTVKPDTMIGTEQIGDYPADRVVVLATGAQGEEFAALMRIASGKHRFINLNERDTIILSSSVIPGNEISVQKLKDNLYRHGARIIHYRASDVHSTGHGNTGELVWIREQVHPEFFMPGYGFHSMLRCHAQANVDAGFPKERVVIPDNGTIVDFLEGNKMLVHTEKAPSSLVMVDGLSVGDVQDVVIRDRKTLAQDGMFVVIATVNAKTGELRKSPDIISRGFVYLRESQDLLGQARLIVKKAIEESTKGMHPVNFEFVRSSITESVARFLLQKTNKRPIVIPVVLGI